MTETDGVVVRLDGAHAWVRAEGAGSACGACARKDGCHASTANSVLDGVAGQSAQLLRLPNTIHAHPGDMVVICAAEGTVLRAVWFAYGIPLMLALTGAMLLDALAGSELAAVIGALLGLGGGFLVMRRKGLDSAAVEPILSISFKRTPLSFHEV